MPTFRVEQRGNHIEIHGAGKPVVYDVSGTELPQLTDHGFAVWHLLPGAMKTGGRRERLNYDRITVRTNVTGIGGGYHSWALTLAGSDYRLESLFEDTSRVAKVGCIASHDAVGSLSFCKRKELRPKNCGECNKCIRTKIMMAASSGTVPDVFLEPALTRKFVNSLDLSIPIERTFFITSYQAARANGTLSAIPGMEERFESLRNPLAVRIRRLFRGR